MKRIFWIAMVLLLAICMAVPCYATETDLGTGEAVETTSGDGVAVEEDAGVSVDWLTDLWASIGAHKDDIAALLILAAGGIFELGVIYFKKKVWPKIEAFVKEQSEKSATMAKAAGQITQANQKQFNEIIKEVKSILSAGGEREKVLLEALALSDKTKEEYKALCENYALQNREIVAALIAQEQMMYETLMSAKLTDARKEEIEKQHLKLKGIYEALASNAIGEEVTDEDVAA